ncbi:Protein CBG05521 [Caenorhabditis briggsae]|uniref:Protein CBG05521 n=1 Tax=Caenorhabditis briggsae TaxID=6238 RepID=A8X026_CAEBR|nr:Protein CBG05521 [Caenorhabditis briggsae]CAP25986.1 Protein CBG05521 [Caenorhabditis briggsae]
MRFFQVLLLVVLISAFTMALPFFNSPTSQTYGGQWRQMYTDESLDVPQNPRYIMSNRMRG